MPLGEARNPDPRHGTGVSRVLCWALHDEMGRLLPFAESSCRPLESKDSNYPGDL